MVNNTRSHVRKVLDLPVFIEAPERQKNYRGRTADISLAGVAIYTKVAMVSGDEVTVTLSSDQIGDHRFNAKVAYCTWCGDKGFKHGLKFVETSSGSDDYINRITT